MPVVAAVRAILLQTGVPVSQTAPKTWPAKWIRIDRVGGTRSRDLDRARILVECFASTPSGARDPAAAESLSYAADQALRLASTAGPWAGIYVTGWEPNTVASFNDEEIPTHARWQFSGNLYLLT